MREITNFADYTVEIWRRPRQRHMHLTVRADLSVRVTCGRRVPRREIFEFIASHSGFIARRAAEWEETRRRFPPRRYLSDESFLFLGRRLPLQVIWCWERSSRISVGDLGLEMVAPLGSSVAERGVAMREFYRQTASELLPGRIQHWSGRMDVQPRALSIREQRTRWGSCSARGGISLNARLICAPEAVIDYVVIHELAHLRHMDHSPQFWQVVESHAPEFRSAKRWLKEHEPEIAAQFFHWPQQN